MRTLGVIILSLVLTGCLREQAVKPAADAPELHMIEPAKTEGSFESLNRMGIIVNEDNEITASFLEDLSAGDKALEIGAGFGYFSIKAIEKGAQLNVNDLSQKHLNIFSEALSEHQQSQVKILPGKFTEIAAQVENASLKSVLAQRVFTYMNPDELANTLNLINQKLIAGGKLYIVTQTPYTKQWLNLIPEYEKRKADKQANPGFFNDLEDYSQDNSRKIASQYLLDSPELEALLHKSGFTIDKSFYLSHNRKSKHSREHKLDGREFVGVIAIKE